MRSIFQLILLEIFLYACLTVAKAGEQPAPAFSLTELENRLSEIDQRLDSLAIPTTRRGVGNTGWSSRLSKHPNRKEWVKVDWSTPRIVDQIVLVPTLWHDSDGVPVANGFPSGLKISGFKQGQTEAFILKRFAIGELDPNRISPLVVNIPPTKLSAIEVKSIQLPKLARGGYGMALAEILVFSNEENIALNKRVQMSSKLGTIVNTTDPGKAVVDGITPFVMNAATGEKSSGCVMFYKLGSEFYFTLDLQKSVPVNRIHLHAIDVEETLPRIQHADYGLPKSMLIEGANTADFSDRVILRRYKRRSIYEAGPIIPIQFPPHTCRYIRFQIEEGYKAPEAFDPHRCIGFTEIEAFSEGENVALGKTIKFQKDATIRIVSNPKNLSDGYNHYGQILSTREWMEQLAERYELESERPSLIAEIDLRVQRQKRTLNLYKWIAGCLVAICCLIFFVERKRRKIQAEKIREQIAADLHDELGSNIYAIRMLSDLAGKEVATENHEALSSLLERIGNLANRTGESARYCASMIESNYSDRSLKEEIERVSARFLSGIDYDLTFEGEEYFDQIKLNTQVSLFLFYKECLTNIAKHSKATLVKATVKTTAKEVQIFIQDNGIGTATKLKSLDRRAKLLSAKLISKDLINGGTAVELTRRLRRKDLRSS